MALLGDERRRIVEEVLHGAEVQPRSKFVLVRGESLRVLEVLRAQMHARQLLRPSQHVDEVARRSRRRLVEPSAHVRIHGLVAHRVASGFDQPSARSRVSTC